MAKWDIINSLDEVKIGLGHLYIKKNQKQDLDLVLEEITKIQLGITEYMRDKSKLNLWYEKHFAKEVHPNTDI
tara:strand:- start:985 stop:1203 length:219 start_codon:yes stop_codon:yes gene_type:complete